MWADLRASYDDGDWVAVMLEDVEGEHPDLDDDATMDLLLRETERLGQVLAERVPDPRAPDPENGGLSVTSARASTTGPTPSPAAGEMPADLVLDWSCLRLRDARWSRWCAARAEHEVRLVH